MKSILLKSLCFVYIFNFALAQNKTTFSKNYIDGELLVQIVTSSNPKSVFDSDLITDFNLISKNLNVFKILFQEDNFYEVNNYLNSHVSIQKVQRNHIINKRTLPNDVYIDSQWQYVNSGGNGGTPNADLDMDLAWDITTGGETNSGNRIVVCVIDDGVDTLHEDFQNNLWRNIYEIPDNGIDDDGNLYVDDHMGWNTYEDNNDIQASQSWQWHGHPVASIVAADGDNNVGVSGVNWDVDLMFVIGGGDEANALKSYDYPLTMKKLYLSSNKTAGANVVVTNASWGVSNAFPEEAPLWCAMYDTLGHYGIINVAATDNRNVDVDVVGDLPTTCSSDFIISVTNVDNTGEKVTGAAYGANSIDLGAPGNGAYTAKRNNTYGSFSGTSAASPHVAGVIGLAYSVPCDNFEEIVNSNPKLGALLIRHYILDNTVSISSLNNITTTGGRLNANNSVRAMMNDCNRMQEIADSILMTLNIEEKSIEGLITYPNPSEGEFNIGFVSKRKEVGLIKVINNLGKTLYEEEKEIVFGEQNLQLNLELSNGVYLIEIKTKDNLYHQRIEIEK